MSASRRAVRHFRAMGCRSTVIIEGVDVDCERLAELAMIGVARLEACWSAFLPDSDVARLNRAGGTPIAVRPATVVLLQAMAEATVVSGGAFDPTVPGRRAETSSWIDFVTLDPDAGLVRADATLRFDPGGIGKGLAADLVVVDAIAAGAGAVAVLLGGDGRVASSDGHRRWAIEVVADGESIDRLDVANAAVATSGSQRAHLVDPATGELHEPGDVIQASVLAGTGATAEALTKAVLLGGRADLVADLDRQGVGVLALDARGRTTSNATWRLHRNQPAGETAA